MKKKICVILTTRGNYAKMKTVMKLIDEDPSLELQLVIGGGLLLPKYGYNFIEIIKEEFKIDRIVHFLVEGENLATMAKSAGIAVVEFSTVFENLSPDVVVVIADRFECLSIAMAATYMNIPVAHVEGGEVSGSIDESIRHAITKLSHLHLPATQDAADRILRLGERKSSVFPVGCTSLDIIKELDLSKKDLLFSIQESKGVGGKVDFNEPYIVVLQHPVTTEYEENLKNINVTIQAIDELGIQTVWIWPNMDAGSDGVSGGIRTYRELSNPSFVRFYKSLPIQYYALLIKYSLCLVGNSSSGIRESSFLGVPCVNIGTRQQRRERGKNTIDVTYDAEEITKAIRHQINHGHYPSSNIFGNGEASGKIVSVLKEFDISIQKVIAY